MATTATATKRALPTSCSPSDGDEQLCRKRQKAAPAAGSFWPAGTPPPMMMPPPPMMMPPWGMAPPPPPYMAMHVCMMMQMHMQQAMAAQAKAGAPMQAAVPADAAASKPSDATLAAKALGHPEGLPTYPSIPVIPPPPMFFGMPPSCDPKAASTAAPAAGKPKLAVDTSDLTDRDFAAFIDSFVSDDDSVPCDKAAPTPGGSSSSSSDHLNLDELLPADAVWEVVESGVDNAAAATASCDSLLELVTPRGDGAEGAEDDLIFARVRDEPLDAALIL